MFGLVLAIGIVVATHRRRRGVQLNIDRGMSRDATIHAMDEVSGRSSHRCILGAVFMFRWLSWEGFGDDLPQFALTIAASV